MKSFYFVIPFIILLVRCKQRNSGELLAKEKSQSSSKLSPSPLNSEFKNYWFDGNAELTSFELEQARYGEIRKGRAVIVFVSEDFSKSRYVKLDYPEKQADDRVKVLKFNLNKQFVTGIYDYALMQSVFTPLDQVNYPNSLRVTTSNIEWCGQFLTRVELNNQNYDIHYNSYFDGEENKKIRLKKNILEDEIWNQIRINPNRLPQGIFEIIPGILTQELVHHDLKVEQASGTVIQKGNTTVYELIYSSIPRKLVIEFESVFPYKIISWEETFETVKGWGMESKVMTTKAKRITDTKLDYWERKYLKDEVLREKELGL
ncbi:septum formation inhibitor Maf [Aquimarina sp. LLG6339-5]|uniref:septum formation inhibitor Maf n=1 Tax=Aquimarina sp. LLG6339-5 TaxID=3160830 RepID=UPI00386B10F5